MHCGHIQKDLQPLIRFYCLFLILVTVFFFVVVFLQKQQLQQIFGKLWRLKVQQQIT